jgi:PAS domain S-box-containing protein
VYGAVLDITERKEAEEALRKAERELKLIFDSAPAMIWQKDREGRYLQVNRKYRDTVGIPEKRILGRTDHDLFPPDIAEKYVSDDREMIRRGQSVFGVEERHSKPSGEYGWSLTDKRVYRDADGNIAGTIGFALDITERKRAEETIRDSLREKEVLLREIHHRVKNNMQVIVSLLRMHSRKTDDANLKHIFADCRDRIDAMALIHQALYESKNLARIDFAAYLEKLCRHIGRAYGIADRSIRMTAETCDATLDMDRGVAVGMIIAELLSNAFKHAFAPGEGGNVSVRLTSPERNAYELIVEDDGRGLPPDFDLRNPSSLGLRLAMAAVTRDLGGSIRAENDGGARFAVRFGTGNPCRKTGGNQE